MVVANAAATEIHERQEPYHLKGLPSLLSIRGPKKAPIFHYQGGTVVQVHLVDLNAGTSHDETEDWGVTHCEVRHYMRNATFRGEKIQGVWQAERLVRLRRDRPWHHPHIVRRSPGGWWDYLRDRQEPVTTGEVYTFDLAAISGL